MTDMTMDEAIPVLADEIYREKVLRARTVPASKKMGWGAELYSEALSRMRSGIRSQFPDASLDEVERILRGRLDRLTQIEEEDVFYPVSRNVSRPRIDPAD